jgi:hypothetical protein
VKIQTKLLFAFLIFPSVVSSLYCQRLELKGRWEGTTQTGEKITIDFKENGSALLFRSQSGISYNEAVGAMFPVSCSLDTTTNPYHFDYKIAEKDTYKGILFFAGKDSVSIYFPFSNENRLSKPDDKNLEETWSLKLRK